MDINRDSIESLFVISMKNLLHTITGLWANTEIYIFEGCILLLLLLQSFWVLSIVTVLFECFLLLLLHTHYIFGPLRAETG
jgi:hypothetical protein